MTNDANAIEIPLSKKKLLLMLAGSLAFVAIGFWFAIAPPDLHNRYSPERLFLLGILAIVFFGFTAFVAMRKLRDQQPGLTIHDRGLHDNTSATPAGEIAWDDVVAIEGTEMSGQPFIVVRVRNPQQYIERQPGGFKRKLMSMNAQMTGTPINIPASSLQIPPEELLALLQRKLDEHRRGNA
jgi:hypothetical protein